MLHHRLLCRWLMYNVMQCSFCVVSDSSWTYSCVLFGLSSDPTTTTLLYNGWPKPRPRPRPKVAHSWPTVKAQAKARAL